MRGILFFSAMMLAAGSATASIPVQTVRAQHLPAGDAVHLSGRVLLQDRPLPGTTLHYPGMFSPLRGVHGGLLATSQRNDRTSG